MTKMNAHIVFFSVKTGAQKTQKLVEIATTLFKKKQCLQIRVPNKQVLQFVDELLWKFPKESFLPHSVEQKDLLVITQQKPPFTGIFSVFNLCPLPILGEPFRVIYEFADTTTPSKKELSHQKFSSYKEAGFPIESHEFSAGKGF